VHGLERTAEAAPVIGAVVDDICARKQPRQAGSNDDLDLRAALAGLLLPLRPGTLPTRRKARSEPLRCETSNVFAQQTAEHAMLVAVAAVAVTCSAPVAAHRDVWVWGEPASLNTHIRTPTEAAQEIVIDHLKSTPVEKLVDALEEKASKELAASCGDTCWLALSDTDGLPPGATSVQYCFAAEETHGTSFAACTASAAVPTVTLGLHAGA
jgi:hypothetical protein